MPATNGLRTHGSGHAWSSCSHGGGVSGRGGGVRSLRARDACCCSCPGRSGGLLPWCECACASGVDSDRATQPAHQDSKHAEKDVARTAGSPASFCTRRERVKGQVAVLAGSGSRLHAAGISIINIVTFRVPQIKSYHCLCVQQCVSRKHGMTDDDECSSRRKRKFRCGCSSIYNNANLDDMPSRRRAHCAAHSHVELAVPRCPRRARHCAAACSCTTAQTLSCALYR